MCASQYWGYGKTAMGKYFRLDDSLPRVAEAIRQTSMRKQDFATHDEIVECMLNDSESKALLEASCVKSSKSPEWMASNMVAWFSKGITSNGPRTREYADEFLRKRIGPTWAYKLKQG